MITGEKRSKSNNSILVVEYDFDIGGAEWVVFNLCNEMAAAGVSVTLLTNRHAFFTGRLDSKVRLVIVGDECSGATLLWRRLLCLTRILSGERFDVLFSTEVFTSCLLALAKLLSAASGRLLIRQASSGFGWSTKGAISFKHRALRYVCRVLYRRADTIIANSAGTRRSLLENRMLGINSRVITLNNPVDVRRIQERSDEALGNWERGFAWEGLRVITIGRLVPQKRVADIILAIGILRRDGIDASLLVLGEGEERSALESLISREQLNAAVYLYGKVENPYPLLRQATVFALASAYEGFGMVLVEALALGIAVVATDIDDGPREILNGGLYGRLYPVGNVQALAECIKYYGNERPDPKRLIERAWCYDKRSMAQEYMKQFGFS